MQCIKLSDVTTVALLREVAENWYGRIGRLKTWIANNPTHPKHEKACELAAEMAVRLLYVANAYVNITNALAARILNKHERGGIVKEHGPEMIRLPSNGRIVMPVYVKE